MAQWTLTDDSTGSPVVMTFDWNPTEFTHPGRKSSLLTQLVSAPNGGIVVFQGRDKPRELSFSGAVGTQSFYDKLDIEKDKHYPLTLTDDQGNTWVILFQTFSWKRIKRRNPWRFDYTATALVL